MNYELTATDHAQIQARGISAEKITAQIQQFQQGFPAIQLDRPCTVGDGIIVLPQETARFTQLHAEAASAGRITKFVPASGAASRMFQLLLSFSQQPGLLSKQAISERAENGDADCQTVQRFLSQLNHLAFSNDLQAVLQADGHRLDDLLARGQYDVLLTHLLTSKGLDYASLPKGLIQFHTYPDHTRTAFEEHLVEATEYARDATSVARLHFTVPALYQQSIREYLETAYTRYADKDTTFELSYSIQKLSTDTIAVNQNNTPFRDDAGALVFRPGGHGALLENLQDLQGDILFIKNIDNVLPDRLKLDTYRYKKLLCGYLVYLQQAGFSHIVQLKAAAHESDGAQAIDAARTFVQEHLAHTLPQDFDYAPPHKQCAILLDRLNRPLRVCGVVKNTGEPGGGPFWVKQADGTTSLQIIESSQVDMTSERQQAIWAAATHFNPVDLVCGVRDYRGRPFDLRHFTDPATGFISEKSKDGRALRALELPGLWNGAMARWNTTFIEVPGSTFHPVKTVMDLLRPEHQYSPAE